MSEQERDELKRLLKEALPPVAETQLRRDLWPAMKRRMEHSSVRVRVPWWDWMLLATASLLMLLFPGMIPALLYHL